MSDPKEHIKRMYAEIRKMTEDGHLVDFEKSVIAGAVESELSRLEELFDISKE